MGRKIVLIATLLLVLNSLAAQALKEPKFQGPLFLPGFNLGQTVVTGANMPVLLCPEASLASGLGPSTVMRLPEQGSSLLQSGRAAQLLASFVPLQQAQ